MKICKVCKEKITKFEYELVTEAGDYYIDQNKEVFDDYDTGTDKRFYFNCPKCGERLFNNKEQAKQFLS